LDLQRFLDKRSALDNTGDKTRLKALFVLVNTTVWILTIQTEGEIKDKVIQKKFHTPTVSPCEPQTTNFCSLNVQCSHQTKGYEHGFALQTADE
jgi:hypothetical protein